MPDPPTAETDPVVETDRIDGPDGRFGPPGTILAAVVGPTASGKSAVALGAAIALGAEIVSLDSMQVYRGMDVGTAKPTTDEQAAVPHHVIDVVDPHEEYTVARFQADVAAALRSIADRGRRALLVGGTGLYFQAAVDRLTIPGRFPSVRDEIDAVADTPALHARLAALDPVAAARMEPTNRRRVLRALEVTLGSGRPFSSFGPGLDAYPALDHPVVALGWPRPALDDRLVARLDAQLAAGFVDEVRRVASGPQGFGTTAAQALGYRELLAHLHDDVSLDAAVATIRLRTRQFAVRQERWFRRDPRVEWWDGTEPTDALVARLVERCSPAAGGEHGMATGTRPSTP